MPVYMTTATEGATIFYTQGSTCPNDPTHDGATPTGTTLIYNPASPPTLGVGQAALFSALGYKTGLADSVITACINEDNVQNGPETGPERSVSYTWDKAGNRSNVTEVPMIGSVSYTTNNLNQYKYVGAKTVSNGTAHEITSYDSVSYAYMGDTYLAQATASPNIYTLYYDALGRCIKRVRSNMGVETINYYLFDGEHWILEYNSTGTTVQSSLLYGNGLDEIVARFNGSAPVGSQLQWPYPDRNNNTSVVTGSGGAILESYRYDAFGAPTIYNPTDTVITATAIANRFLFTGREWNPEFKFYEYRARAYNPALGRFMTEDPKGFDAGDYNLYRYVANDPLDRVDPMGLDSPELMRLIVPGQVAYDNAVTSFQNGNYGYAAAFGVQMLAEQGLAVTTLGTSGQAQAGTRAAIQTERAVAARFAAAASERQVAMKAGEGIKSALMPGGKLIGDAGSKGVREIEGGLKDAQSMFKQLSQGGKAVENSTYKGTLVELPGGGTVGLREVATKSPGTVATIDVKTPEITVKLKYGQ